MIRRRHIPRPDPAQVAQSDAVHLGPATRRQGNEFRPVVEVDRHRRAAPHKRCPHGSGHVSGHGTLAWVIREPFMSDIIDDDTGAEALAAERCVMAKVHPLTLNGMGQRHPRQRARSYLAAAASS